MLVTLPLLTLALLVPPPAAPAPSPQEVGQARSASETAVEYFRPRNAPADELSVAVQRLYPHPTTVVSGPGGTAGPLAPTVLVFGETLVVRDRADRLGEVVALLRALDEQWSGPRAEGEALETLDYRARYVTLDSLSSALLPFQHPITLRSRGQGYQTNNLSFLEERGTLIARGTPEELAQIRDVLERIDVPQPQVLLTCYLIEGREEAPERSTLPPALTENLSRLVPFAGFERLATGMLRSDALAAMSLAVEFAPGSNFELELRPRAYEEAGRTLTFERCMVSLARPRPDGRSARQVFTTSARVRAGEYVVLGAVGAEPVFVVLHVALVEG